MPFHGTWIFVYFMMISRLGQVGWSAGVNLSPDERSYCAFGLVIGIVFGNIFEIKRGKGIALGIGCGLVIGSMIAKSKANGSEQAEEDEYAMTDEEIKQGELLADEGGELLTDKEEKQVWEEFQGKEEEGDN